MATNMTYASLISDMQTYLERGGSAVSDPTVYNQLPRLINAAERKLAQDLKILGQIEVLIGTTPTNGLQVNVPVINKPDRWRETVSIAYGAGTDNNTYTQLFPRSFEYCKTLWPDATQTSPPQFYAEMDLAHWLIVPTPDANYPIQIMAYMQPPLLDSSNQSNFWTEYCPNALLYGSLLEATPFLKDDPRIAIWQGYWAAEIATLNEQDVQRMMDRASQRNRV